MFVDNLTEAIRNLDGVAPTLEIALIVQGKRRELAALTRAEAYCISCEALRNAVRHSAAKRIEVEVHYGSVGLRVRVRDDGCGICREKLQGNTQPGGGLLRMHQHAHRLHTEIRVWSAVNAGTEIELAVPARTAYATAPRRASYARLLHERMLDAVS